MSSRSGARVTSLAPVPMVNRVALLKSDAFELQSIIAYNVISEFSFATRVYFRVADLIHMGCRKSEQDPDVVRWGLHHLMEVCFVSNGGSLESLLILTRIYPVLSIFTESRFLGKADLAFLCVSAGLAVWSLVVLGSRHEDAITSNSTKLTSLPTISYRGMNYLHECKPDPLIHCDLRPKNILLDSAGQLKFSGFGLIRLSKISPNKERLLRPVAIDRTNLYIAPEIYKDELFDRGADAYSFDNGGCPTISPQVSEEVVNLILIEECWYPDLAIRPKFSEIIILLDKIVGNCTKQGWWKDAFKFPW
ncbi:hypothetical protein L2E82_40832 [Cichorium intybus]|uniref:Uncharacterized protein n=1 Tax=Cichorium intybus TaxID=13427 RepID=A0ACB9ALC2_CICIN|nr:hypothetical protein L2E82_40832 [Cichorium intybus]